MGVYTLKVWPGEHITKVCERLAAEAASRKGEVVADFNGISIHARPGDDAAGLEDDWTAEMERRSLAYRNSPESKLREAERAAETARLQAEHDRLVRAPAAN